MDLAGFKASNRQGWKRHDDETKYWPAEQCRTGIQEAAAVLAAGGVIAFPTETVYGLGGDARSTEAVERIFAAKGRPSDNPLNRTFGVDGRMFYRSPERVNDIEAGC